MASFKHKTYGGVTGYSLENFVEFLTGKKPIETKLEGRTIVFYISDSMLSEKEENTKMLNLLTAFENRYNAKFCKISDL